MINLLNPQFFDRLAFFLLLSFLQDLMMLLLDLPLSPVRVLFIEHDRCHTVLEQGQPSLSFLFFISCLSVLHSFSKILRSESPPFKVT